MTKNNAIESRHYKCPGCHVDLAAGTAAVAHMVGCARLQAMIAAGRAQYKAECKKDEDLRNVKFCKRLERCNGNYFAQTQTN